LSREGEALSHYRRVFPGGNVILFSEYRSKTFRLRKRRGDRAQLGLDLKCCVAKRSLFSSGRLKGVWLVAGR